MSDDAPAVPTDNDHVVKTAGTILNQRDDGPAPLEMAANERRIPGERGRLPTPCDKVTQKVLTPDAAGFSVNERAEGLGVHAGRAPVTHHHGGGGSAAERLALRQKRDVEEAEGLSSGLRARTARQRRSGQRDDGGCQKARSPVLQS